MSLPPETKKWMAEVGKKIADLTKTVFRLHAETLDRKEEVNDLRAHYEEELALAAEKSKQLIDEAQQNNQNYTEKAESVVRKAYDDEFAALQQQFNEIKSGLESQSQQLIDSSTQRIDALKAEIDDLRKKTEAQMASFQNVQAELQKLSHETVGNIAQRHKQELQKHVTQANARYNELVIEAAAKEETLKAKYDAEIAELRRNLAEGQQAAIARLAQHQK
jgi:serologically defined colon cancer antigen 8